MANHEDEESSIITQGGTRRPRIRLSTETLQAVDSAADARLEDAHRRMDAIDENVLAHVRDVRLEISDVRSYTVEVGTRVSHIEGQMVHLVRSYERTADQAARGADAELELRKAERLRALEDQSQDRAARRKVWTEFAFKAAAILMGAWALVSALITKRC